MYPPWSQNGRPLTRAGHECNGSDAEGRSQQNAYRPVLMEPRPTLHTRLTESTGRLALRDTRSFQDYSEHHSGGQKLPALRDVLSQDYSPMSASTAATRHHDGPASTSHSATKNPYPIEGFHPPMALPSPPLHDPRYWLESNVRFGISGVADNRGLQSIPLTSHNGYPGPHPRYADVPLERSPETAAGPPPSNGILNHHEQAPSDEVSSRLPSRASRHSHPQSRSENHGKYLRVEDVPGEGEFFVYEDGHRIPTYVDGEQVNPNWGLTKANKPRKRLATACLDCREKKIKCEPGAKSCVQCEKAMRPCRKAADKYSQADAPANVMYVAGSPVRKGPPVTESGRTSSRTAESEYLHKRRIRADPSPPLEPSKKHRDHSPPLRPSDENGLRIEDGVPTAGQVEAHRLGSLPKDPFSWEDDPYAVEPEMTLRLLDVYFEYINNAAYCIFPQRHFLNWMKEFDHKCQNERMVLYAMLAAASVFAGHEFTGFGKQCFRVAGDALATQLGKFNIATATSKLLLAFYHHAKGAEASEWDLIGSAIRTVTTIDLNTEAGCLNDAISRSQQRFEFAFSPEQLAECKRRVLWCTFLQDRFCNPAMCSLKPEDIFVRLPCSEEAYENGVASNAPRFANGIVDCDSSGPLALGQVSHVAWLIPVVAAWGDVTDFIFRGSHRSGSTYRAQYQSFYASMQIRLQAWLETLPEHWQYTPSNLARSIQDGYSHTFVLAHILRHYALIKLNRFMRHKYLQDVVVRNIRAANQHAHDVLQIVNETQIASRGQTMQQDPERPAVVFTSPIVVFAITAAIDVVSAGGNDSKFKYTMDKIDQSLSVLNELEHYWNIAKNKKKECQYRYGQLVNVSQKPKAAKSGCWMGRKWGTITPMEEEFGLQNDCIYGLGEKEGDEASQLYFEAFQED